MEIDGFLIGVGAANLAMALPAVVSPHKLHRASKRNRNRRLEELRNGARENYFEEQRELEAYEPHSDPSNEKIRAYGWVGLALSVLLIVFGFTD